MRKRKAITIFFLIFLLLPVSLTSIIQSNFRNFVAISEFERIMKADPPFSITSNAQFSTYATGGNGSESNPWVLEDFVIDDIHRLIGDFF